MTSENTVRVRDVALACVMIAGGVFAGATAFAHLKVDQIWWLFAGAGFGAAAGGCAYTVYRRSGDTTSALLGAAVGLLPFGYLISKTPALSYKATLFRFFVLAAIVIVGTAIGATLARRMSRKPDRDGTLYWMLLAASNVGGIWWLLQCTFADASAPSSSTAVWLMLGALFFGSLLTQAISSTRRVWLCSSGLFAMLVWISAIASLGDSKHLLEPLAGIILWPLGAAGAWVGWHLFAKRNSACETDTMAAVFD